MPSRVTTGSLVRCGAGVTSANDSYWLHQTISIECKPCREWSASYPPCQPNSGITALPQCSIVEEKLFQCNTSLPLPQRQTCFCSQEIFAALFDCKSEQRLCLENDNYDAAIDNIITNWHTECDSFVSSETSSFTTPSVTSLTATYDVLNCQSIGQSCLQVLQASTTCYTMYTLPADFDSCLCQSSILSLASVCEYDGNISCKLTTANIQSVYGWGTCEGYQTVLTTPMQQTSLGTQSSSITISPTTSSSMASSVASLTITQPPFISGSPMISGSASGAQSMSSTQSSSSQSVTTRQRYLLGWTIFTVIVICVVMMLI